MDDWNIKCVIIEKGLPLEITLIKNDWEKVYQDEITVIYQK
jgi:hypothetical protein